MNRARDAVALVLAVAAGLAVLLLTVAAIYDARTNQGTSSLSEAYSALLTGTLGVMIGALAGYIGGRHDPDQSGPDRPRDPTPAEPRDSKTAGREHNSLIENDSQTDRRADE